MIQDTLYSHTHTIFPNKDRFKFDYKKPMAKSVVHHNCFTSALSVHIVVRSIAIGIFPTKKITSNKNLFQMFLLTLEPIVIASRVLRTKTWSN